MISTRTPSYWLLLTTVGVLGTRTGDLCHPAPTPTPTSAPWRVPKRLYTRVESGDRRSYFVQEAGGAATKVTVYLTQWHISPGLMHLVDWTPTLLSAAGEEEPNRRNDQVSRTACTWRPGWKEPLGGHTGGHTRQVLQVLHLYVPGPDRRLSTT